MRQLYTFDSMQVALTPVVPADVKRAADDVLCGQSYDDRVKGERLTLAHRGSGRIAEALLSGSEVRVMQAALHNARLTDLRSCGRLCGERFRGLCGCRCVIIASMVAAAGSAEWHLSVMRRRRRLGR